MPYPAFPWLMAFVCFVLDPDAWRESLPTGATLVVAPSHLTGQWKEELATHAPNLRVILITTKPQYDKVAMKQT